MLYFPKKILTASGTELAPQSEDVRWGLKGETVKRHTPIAIYPRPDYDEEQKLIAAATQKVMRSRAVIPMFSGSIDNVNIKNIKELFPEPLAAMILDMNQDDEKVREAVTAHFKEKSKAWLKSLNIPPDIHLTDSMFAGGNFKPIWEKVLPKWLTTALQDVPILAIPVDGSDQSDYGTAVAPEENITAIRYQTTTKKSLNHSIIFEEAMHIAQGQSKYWQEHVDDINDAAAAFKERIAKRDEDGKLDPSPEAKRPRQLLRQHKNVDHDSGFWKYDKSEWAGELIVDMALIEAQLLTRAGNGKPRSQEKVNEMMAERFPEMIDYYRGFMDDVMKTAAAKLEGTDAEKEEKRQKWAESPMRSFAKKTYSSEQGRA